jgi:VIT1/CCC1 family predicted Fe2+/Mn2+ transporter
MFENWKEEKQSAWLYRIMATCENDKQLARMFTALADAAEAQARLWEAKLLEEGRGFDSSFKPSRRSQLVAMLIKRLGPRAIKPVLAAMKVRGLSVYGGSSLGAGHPMPASVDEVGYRHSSLGGGGNLRAAVFGANDGLISNASLVMGVAGAAHDPGIILTTGIAGLIAGAASMAAGEYVSVRSQRELYEYQIQLEREELEEYPEEEAEELALIYHARGVSLEQARAMATELIQDKEHALDTLAREELGLNPGDLGSPVTAAMSSFAAFGVGALIPLLPFLYSGLTSPVPVMIVITGIALFIIGALISLFTGKSAIRGGFRMALIGGCAALLTYSIGLLLGVTLL